MRALLLVIVALAGCKEVNSKYCRAHPEDTDVCGFSDAAEMPDVAIACESNADCAGQVCDTTASPPECVQCFSLDDAACTGTTPVCGANRACRGCASDAECPDSDVCLADGSCADAANVIYAVYNGSGMASCGAKDMPCSLAQALANAMAPRTIIKLVPGSSDFTVGGSSGFSVNSKTITLAASGATIRKNASGALVTIGATANVTILGGIWTAAGMGDVVSCTSGGVLSLSGADLGGGTSGFDDAGCSLSIDRSTIHDNAAYGINKTAGSLTLTRSRIQTNTAGGVYLTGSSIQFRIVGNIFWQNGNNGVPTGGIHVSTNTGPTSRLDFNTFNANTAYQSKGSAIDCDVAGFTARNNVMFGNTGTNNNEQVSGVCNHTYSIASPGILPVGAGNSASDPMFADALTGNLHTKPASPTENAADPASDLTGVAATDLDGDVRTAPADIGADQHP